MRHFYKQCLLLFVIIQSTAAWASDIGEVTPLTNRIIMLHFDDGYIRHHRKGEPRANEWAVQNPLNTTAADNLNSYSISSADDMDFFGSILPISISRKTKGTDFSWICEAWDPVNGCINTNPDHTKEHWVYIFLDKPLKNGMTYTVTLSSDLNAGNTSVSFTYDDKISRSEAVHVNIIGYSPAAENKYGYVYHWMGSQGGLDLSAYAGANFWLINTSNNSIAYSGTVAFRKPANNAETGQTTDTPNANFLGAEVYECDFSGFSSPGEYRLAVEGIGASFPFVINSNAYFEPFKTIVRSLYHQRSGIELKQPYTEYTRPAPHNPTKTPGFQGKLKYTSSRFIDWANADHSGDDRAAIEGGIKGSIDTWGWYQDAGDWDGYFSHMRIPAMLSFMYEFAPGKYTDNQLNLPESGNGVPDIIDEASWLPRYFYRTRHAILDAGYGTGGVGSRAAGDWFGSDGEGVPSYEDVNRTYIVSGEDPYSTYMYAANAAHLAITLQKAGKQDPENINWQQEATEAYAWANANTLSGDENKQGLTLKHIRMYAAASLYKLTGVASYHEQFKLDASDILGSSILGEDQRWGVYTYLTMGANRTVDAPLYQKLKEAAITSADFVTVNYVNNRAARYGGNYWFPMLVGQASTPMVFEGIAGYFLTKDSNPSKAQSYLANIYTTADYFLGNNPLNMAWATGLGERHPNHVFHMDSWYNGRDTDGNNNEGEFYPGIVPYGPWRKDGDIAQGPWDHDWAMKTTYPAYDTWPGHERWFDLRTAPTTAEFTIHQNTILAAVTYGFLIDGPEGNTTTPPTELVVADFDEVIPTEGSIEPGRTQMFAGGGTATIIDNPITSDANTSARVGRFERAEGTWKLIGWNMQNDNAINGFNTFSFQLYGSGITEVYVSLGNADGVKALESFQNVSIDNTWTTISIPVPDSISVGVKDVLIFPNPNNAAAATYYIDNIKFTGEGAAIPVTGVALSSDSLSISLGEAAQLFMTITPGNATNAGVAWSSSDEAVATVDGNGIVTATGLGSAVVTVTTTEGGFTDSAVVTVAESASGFSYIVADFDEVIPTIEVIEPGRTQMFGSGALSIIDNPYKDEYNNSNKVAQLDRGEGNWKLIGWNMQTGLPIQTFYSLSFQIYGSGITEIFISLQDESGTRITEGFKSVSIDNRWATVEMDLPLNSPGNVRDILIFPNPNNASAATYWVDNVKFNSKVESIPVTSIDLSASNLSLAAGTASQLTATILPANATNKNVIWSSTNTSIVTVNSNGLVQGVSEGSAFITATTADGGYTDSTLVEVTPGIPFNSLIVADFDTVIPTINVIEPGKTQMFSGGTLAIVGNPSIDENNVSENVIRFNRDAGAWKLVGFNMQTPRSISEFNSFSFQVNGSNITEVYVALNDSAGTQVVESFQSVTGNTNWQTITVGIPANTVKQVRDILIFINPNNADAASYHIDNVMFKGDAATFLPQITLTSPTDGQVFEADSTVTITAEASDADGTISHVIFMMNDSTLAHDTTAPYEQTVANVQPGVYTIIARAVDNNGHENSDTVNITVEVKNVAPIITVTSPSEGDDFIEGSDVTISANAVDTDGTITHVTFWHITNNEWVWLTNDDTAPYSVVWQNATSGAHQIYARAVDNKGASTDSYVTINVLTGYTVGNCTFTVNDFPEVITEIVAVNKTAYANFYTKKNPYVIGIATGIRADGNGGIWEIHNDCSIHPLRKSGSIQNTSLLPDIKGLEARWGWQFKPTHISNNGRFIYAHAINNNGYNDNRYGVVIEPGTSIPVRFKLGNPHKGRISDIDGRIECIDVKYRKIGKNFLAVRCDDDATNNLNNWLSEAQKIFIYPNPTDGTIRLNLPDNTSIKIKVMDALGKIVFDGTYDAGDELALPLQSGMYHVVLYTSAGKSIQVQKLIVK